jgi:hypothetical protein
VGEKPIPNALSRRVLPEARDVQQPSSRRPATNVDREKRVVSAARR